MLQSKKWQECVFLVACILAVVVCNAAASGAASSENSGPSEFALLVQSKQAKQARICRADPQLLGSLVGNSGDAEVMVTVPNEHLEQIAEFQEEADLWVLAHVARFLPATRITHVLVGDDVVLPTGDAANFLVPAMLRLRSALAAAGLDGRVRVSTALSADTLAAPACSDVAALLLRFLKATGALLFLKSEESAGDADAEVDAAFGAMRALGVSGVPVIAIGAARGCMAATYYCYGYGPREGGGRRRSLATTGTFCVALQSADPTALQAGLNWACGPGHADCSAIQPGGACYKANNLPALASYAYNDYYQKQAGTGATCSFNGTATTTTTDPSSGSCVFAGSSMAGGSNSTPPVGASPPTSLAPPAGFTPPFGSSPPSSDLSPPAFGTTPPTGFITPPAGGSFGPPSFGSPPTEFGPPGAFNGSGSFGPSGTLEPYGAAGRGAASYAGLTALSAVAVAVLLVSLDVM